MKQFRFPNVFMGNSIFFFFFFFDIAKTNNDMMSSVLSNILGWPGGNSSKQVRLIHMHASRHDSVTLAQLKKKKKARCGL